MDGSYPALLVQQIQDAEFSLDQIDTRLVVVEVDERPGNLLLHVLLLLQLEHVLQKHDRNGDHDLYCVVLRSTV